MTLLPVLVVRIARVPKEGNRVGHFNGSLHRGVILVLVGGVELKNELVLSFRHQGLLAARGRKRDAFM